MRSVSRKSISRVWLLQTIVVTASVFADTYYVRTNGSHFALGSALDPHLLIQEGLDGAASGDTVLVGPGVYTGAGNLNLSFGGKSIELKSEAGADLTMIRCSDQGRAFTLTSGDTTNAVIDDFTITDANSIVVITNGAPGGAIYYRYFGTNGSAVVCYPGGGASFRNCRFLNNRADSVLLEQVVSVGNQTNKVINGNGYGGAILSFGGDILISNCLFRSNSGAVSGGALFAGSNSTLRVFDSLFSENASWSGTDISITDFDGDQKTRTRLAASDSRGGAVHLENASTATLTRCYFLQNTSGVGGAISAVMESRLDVTGSRLSRNVASATTSNAGGGALSADSSVVSMTATTVDQNHAGEVETDLEILAIDGDQVTDVRILKGKATGGGILADGDVDLVITNCILRYNSAAAGGGGVAVMKPRSLLVTHCQFVENRLTGMHSDGESEGGGGAILIDSAISNACIDNSSLIGNDASTGSTVAITISQIDGSQELLLMLRQYQGSSAGGGALIRDSDGVVISNLEVIANSSTTGAGLCLDACSNTAIYDLTAVSNRAVTSSTELSIVVSDYGPGYTQLVNVAQESYEYGAGGGLLSRASTFTLDGALFGDNKASWGSAIGMIGSESLIRRVMARNNSALDEFDRFAITDGSGNPLAPATITVTSRPIFAVALEASSSSMDHITVFRSGGYLTNSIVTMVNSVVWSNDWELDDTTIFTSSYSCVLGLYPGEGNIMVDPLLTMKGRLTSNSPCIDTAWIEPGYTRDFEGESVSGSGPDIGADEFVDSDNDGLTDAWERENFNSLSSVSGDDDTDHDGASESVEELHGSNPHSAHTNGEIIPDGWLIHAGLDPLLFHEGLDQDSDGYIALDEYISDTDPLDSEDYLNLDLAPASSGAGPTIGWPGASGRWYRVEYQLEPDGPWSVAVGSIAGSNAPIVVGTGILTNIPGDHVELSVKARLNP